MISALNCPSDVNLGENRTFGSGVPLHRPTCCGAGASPVTPPRPQDTGQRASFSSPSHCLPGPLRSQGRLQAGIVVRTTSRHACAQVVCFHGGRNTCSDHHRSRDGRFLLNREDVPCGLRRGSCAKSLPARGACHLLSFSERAYLSSVPGTQHSPAWIGARGARGDVGVADSAT